MNQAISFSAADSTPPPKQAEFSGIVTNADPTQGPILIDGADTLVKLFAKRCTELGPRTAHREKHLGIWRAHSWADYWTNARLIGLGLKALGFQRGEVVSILSEDRKEWLYTDLGVQCVGGITSGIYTTDSASQLAYLVNDSDSRVLFLENDEQLDKYLSVRDTMPGLAKVVVYEREGLHGLDDDGIIFLDDLCALGADFLAAHPGIFEAEIARSEPQDIALLIYTSGTTGRPKGAMLSHANMMFGMSVFQQTIPGSGGDEIVCFLPLSHVFERSWSAFGPICNRAIVNFAESPQTVFENMREVSPTRVIAVPRVWEKLYSRVAIMARETTALGRFAYARALAAGMRRLDQQLAGGRVSPGTALAYAFWDRLVLANIRRMLGLERVRFAISGAAPISPDILRWFRAIGVPILEGYGQTEGTGLASVNRLGAFRLGSVGQSMPGVAFRLSADDEILVKGFNVFPGYWRDPEKTAETVTPDGWLRTGDLGEVDADGFVTITGRSKDIIITAGGKNITPAEIENRLKFSPYITDAVVIGDARKFLTALIMIDQENVETFAQDKRVPFNDFASLCAAPAVKALIKGVIAQVNQDCARAEQIKDFRIIDVLLTAEDDELTATMKLKRSFVEKKYKCLIDPMYT